MHVKRSLAPLAFATISASSLVAARPVAAQEEYSAAFVPHPPAAACVDALPPSAYSRVAVYVTSASTDSALAPAARSRLLSSADDLLQDAAVRARHLLAAAAGVADSVLPSAEPLLGDSTHAWRGVGAPLDVTAYRDGRVTWHVPSRAAGDTLAGALLARSLAAEVAGGATRFWWPSDSILVGVDSAHFAYRFIHASVDRNGKPHEPKVERPIEAVFSMRAPWEEPIRVLRARMPTYPDKPKFEGFRADVVLRFVVDTSGRARDETIRAQWPSGVQALVGKKLDAYNEFVAATRRAVLATRFVPARVGGCAVEQDIRQSYSFELTSP